MEKIEIARILEEIAFFLEIKGDNPFKARAYRQASRNLLQIKETEFLTLMKEERLTEIPGIGKSLAGTISQLYHSDNLNLYNKLKEEVPEGLIRLIQIYGVRGHHVKSFFEILNIKTIEDLKNACLSGELSKIKGFRAERINRILKMIENYQNFQQQFLWWSVYFLAVQILENILSIHGVIRAEIGGSIRRKLEIVGDIDFIVATKESERVIKSFIKHPMVIEVISKESNYVKVRLRNGVLVDFYVIPLKYFKSYLFWYTGSLLHINKLEKKALENGYILSKEGLVQLNDKPKVKYFSERKLYKTLSLDYIPPELREGGNEFEASEKHALPKLLRLKDLRGTFHVHTTASDGSNSLEQMVKAAEDLQWDYIGISDHSKSSFQANGLSEDRLIQQITEIQQINQSKKFKIHIFAGLECDILEDGTLDFDNDILKELDFVIVSIHRRYRQNEDAATKRLIKAIENPYTTMIGHLTGRLLLNRESVPVNIPKVLDACAANGKIIELNCSPSRLEMDWRYWPDAINKGILCSINPDAHGIGEFKYMSLGINIARKGWLEKHNVFNTFSLKQVTKYLKRKF